MRTVNIKDDRWLSTSVRYCYFVCMMAVVFTSLLLFLRGDNIFNGEPMELNEFFVDEIPVLMKENGRLGAVLIVGPIGLFSLFLSNSYASRYKKTYRKLLNNCYIACFHKYVILSFLSMISIYFLISSNGNMVFLFCYVLFISFLLLNFPTKERVMRTVEAAVEKNNQLPDDPNATKSVSGDNDKISK